MSKDEQQTRGGFVPLGELADALPGFIPRGREMSAQARHHFTTLRQVTQLIEASEADADRGFIARLLALCSLPRTNPSDRHEFKRVNGPYTLYMTAINFPMATSHGCSWRGSAQRRCGRSAASWSSGGPSMSSCESSAWGIGAGARAGTERGSRIKWAGCLVRPWR